MVRILVQLLMSVLALHACSARSVPSALDGQAESDSAAAKNDSVAGPCTYRLGGDPLNLSSDDDGLTFHAPELALTGDTFGAIWWEMDAKHDSMIKLRRISREGTILGDDPESIITQVRREARIAADGGQFGLCWDTGPLMQGSVSFQRLSASGIKIGSGLTLSTDYNDLCASLVPADKKGWAAIVRKLTKNSDGSTRSSYALVLADEAGKPSVVTLLDSGAHAVSMSLVRTREGYVVAYATQNDNKIWLQRFTLGGKANGPPLLVTRGTEWEQEPVLVYTGANLILLHVREGDPPRIIFRRFDEAGKEVGSPIPLTSQGFPGMLFATWTGHDVALSWFRTEWPPPPGVSPPGPLFLSLLRPDGTRLQQDIQLVDSAFVHESRIAGTRESLGILWREDDFDKSHIRFVTARCDPARS